MALEPIQQLSQLLSKSQKVLVLLPENPEGDLIAAAWATYHFLKRKNIQSDIAFTDEFKEAEKFSFLPRPEKVSDNIYGSQDFLLLFNTKYNNITDVRTERDDEEFRIYITPEKGSIDPRDFSFVPAKFKYDLLFILGAPEKEATGKIFAESPDIFFEVPIINVDCRSTNENFGQLNFVDLTASSVSENLAGIFRRIDSDWNDPVVAECLLAGIIAATESFQKKNTTPRSLQLAAELMEKGADQQKINRYLFKTQPLNLLKLWGRAMVRLNWEEAAELVWSEVTLEDLVQSRTLPTDLPFVLEKLQDNYSNGKAFAVFFEEKPGSILALVRFAQAENLKRLSEVFKGRTFRGALEFRLEKETIQAAAAELVRQLKNQTS